MDSLLLSFFVYTFFALAMFVWAKRSCRAVSIRGGTGAIPKGVYKGLLGCIILFSLVAGLRYDVGVDHLAYLSDYLQVLRGKDAWRERGIEYGYMLFTQLYGALGIHPTIYFGSIAAIQLTFFFWPYRKEYAIVPFMMFLLMLGGFFFTWMNGIRQMVAACIFVFSIPFIQNRKFVPFLACMFLAFLWHQSAIILLPFYLFAYSKLAWSNRMILFPIFLSCFVLGNTPFWINNLSNLELILGVIGYDYYADKFNQIMEDSRTLGFGPRMMFTLLQYIMVIYFYPKCRSYYKSSLMDINFKLFFIGVCGYYLFVNTNHIFLRPIEYFTIFALPMSAYVITYFYRNRRYFLFFIFLLASATFTYVSCLSDANVSKYERKSFLYQFYFDNKK